MRATPQTSRRGGRLRRAGDDPGARKPASGNSPRRHISNAPIRELHSRRRHTSVRFAAGFGRHAHRLRKSHGWHRPAALRSAAHRSRGRRTPAGHRPRRRLRRGRGAPGEYRIEPATPGFTTVTPASFQVGAGTDPVRIDVVLGPSGIAERVVVAATRGDAVASTLGVAVTIIDGGDIEARHPQTLLHLLTRMRRAWPSRRPGRPAARPPPSSAAARATSRASWLTAWW